MTAVELEAELLAKIESLREEYRPRIAEARATEPERSFLDVEGVPYLLLSNTPVTMPDRTLAKRDAALRHVYETLHRDRDEQWCYDQSGRSVIIIVRRGKRATEGWVLDCEMRRHGLIGKGL